MTNNNSSSVAIIFTSFLALAFIGIATAWLFSGKTFKEFLLGSNTPGVPETPDLPTPNNTPGQTPTPPATPPAPPANIDNLVPTWCTPSHANSFQNQKNFKSSEFKDMSGKLPPKALRGNLNLLMAQMQKIRTGVNQAFPGPVYTLPLRIETGYLSYENYELEGGERNHTCGGACTFYSDTITPLELYQVVKEMQLRGEVIAGGIGYNSTVVYYDVFQSRNVMI